MSQLAKAILTLLLWAVLTGIGLAVYQIYHWFTYGAWAPIGLVDSVITLSQQSSQVLRAGTVECFEWLLSRPLAGMLALIPAGAITLIVTSSLRPRL